MANAKHGENRFDVLRLTAAWLVLFSHSYPISGASINDPLTRIAALDTLGGVGVITFFALSGYLVTLSLQRNSNLLVFLWHRIVRIYPGLMVVCGLSMLVLGPLFTALPVGDYFEHPETWSYLWSATGFDAVFRLPEVFNQVPLAQVVNGSLWSLPIEVRFYLALAVVSLMPAAMRFKALIVAAGLFAMLLLRPPALPQHETFFGLDYQHTKLGLVFALGAVYASWGDRIRPLFWPAAYLIALAAALAAGSAVSTACFLLGAGTLVLWLGLHAKWLPAIPERMGDWSYGLFLYAFPVQQVLAHYGVHKAGIVPFVTLSTVVALAFAALSWHLVEKRALRLRRWARTQMIPAAAATR
jgi:peptidoglycan/LPS O-acetylase OafA/YrhL